MGDNLTVLPQIDYIACHILPQKYISRIVALRTRTQDLRSLHVARSMEILQHLSVGHVGVLTPRDRYLTTDFSAYFLFIVSELELTRRCLHAMCTNRLFVPYHRVPFRAWT